MPAAAPSIPAPAKLISSRNKSRIVRREIGPKGTLVTSYPLDYVVFRGWEALGNSLRSAVPRQRPRVASWLPHQLWQLHDIRRDPTAPCLG